MAETQAETQYFDLTPRKRAMILEASLLSSPGDDVEKPDRASPPFVTQTSQRGRGVARRGSGDSPRRQKGKENVGTANRAPPGAEGSLTKAALKRQEVVDRLSQAQADARSRLCIFKSKEEAGNGDGEAAAPDPEEQTSRSGVKPLTVPHAPTLRTGLRSSSQRARSLSVGDPNTPLRGFEPELSRASSRGTSREHARAGTPEMSVRSMRSMRSVRSMHSVMSSASICTAASLAGRKCCTRPLTFPQGPNLQTEARSRSHSVGARTPSAGTPERQSRSHSVSSARSASRTPSRMKLTVPFAPMFATELRSRSRANSVGTRTPSAHSVGTSAERSVRSSRGPTVPIGPNLATSLRSRSHSVGAGTPSHSVGTPHRSVRSSCAVTIPRGPLLTTELRSRSRVRTPSAHSVGSVRSCVSRESFRSCSSLRGSSVTAQPRPLTVPVGPLLETQLRAGSRSRCAGQAVEPEALRQMPQVTLPAAAAVAPCGQEKQEEQTYVPVEAQDEESPASTEKTCEPEETVQALPAASSAASSEDEPCTAAAPADAVNEPVHLAEETAAGVSSTDVGDSPPVEHEVQTAPAPTMSNLLGYLPDASLKEPESTTLPETSAASKTEHASDKVTCEDADAAATAESRAESRKQQVLAKVAQEHANNRKQHFVFGKTGTTPSRTPGSSRKKVESQIRKEVDARTLNMA